jgi:DNA-binding FadR family transcriptional regulator
MTAESAHRIPARFERVRAPETLHARLTRTLALRVIRADREGSPLVFPNESMLCEQLGVSRTILREALKVLADKGMVEVRPRSGMRALPRTAWKLLDPDILAWQSAENPDAGFLRDLCEIRLALEPTASGFAAVRASAADLADIEAALERRTAVAEGGNLDDVIELDLQVHACVIKASRNRLFQYLSDTIREPLRVALSYTLRNTAVRTLEVGAQRLLVEAIRRQDPLAARAAADKLVGDTMVAVENVIRHAEERRSRRRETPPADAA